MARMDFDLNMLPNDSGMADVQEDQNRVAPAAHGSRLPVYVVPALLYFGEIPADAATVQRFQNAFGLSAGSTLDLRAIQLQAPHVANAPLFQRDIMSDMTWPSSWNPTVLQPSTEQTPCSFSATTGAQPPPSSENSRFSLPAGHAANSFEFAVPHGQPEIAPSEDGMITRGDQPSEVVNSECGAGVDTMEPHEVTNGDDDEGSNNMGSASLQADHAVALAQERHSTEPQDPSMCTEKRSMVEPLEGTCMCEDCTQAGPCMCEECTQGGSMTDEDDGGQEVAALGIEAASVEEQLHDHASVRAPPANDVEAQASVAAAASTNVAVQPVAAEKQRRKRKSTVVSDANSDLCNPEVVDLTVISAGTSSPNAAASTTIAVQPLPAKTMQRRNRKARVSDASSELCNPDVVADTTVVPAAAGITTDVVNPGAVAPIAKKSRPYRRGPVSRSSEYMGVTHYQRTGRWEAHIWLDDEVPHRQLYLGASATKEEAARAYDKAALVLKGPDFGDQVNIKPARQYDADIRRLRKLTTEQMAIFLRRDSKGPGAVATYPCVKKDKGGKFEATYKQNWKRTSPPGEPLGTFDSEEEAARAVCDRAVQENNKQLARMITDISFVRTLPTTAQQAAIDAGLPLSVEKPITRRRGPQKAPRKPYAPRKKKGVNEAGVYAAAHHQTLQDTTTPENGSNNTVVAAPGSTVTDHYVELPAAADELQTSVTSLQLEVDVVGPTSPPALSDTPFLPHVQTDLVLSDGPAPAPVVSSRDQFINTIAAALSNGSIGADELQTSVTSLMQHEVDVVGPTSPSAISDAPFLQYVQTDLELSARPAPAAVLSSRDQFINAIAAALSNGRIAADELPIAATVRSDGAAGAGVLTGGRGSSAFRPYRPAADPWMPGSSAFQPYRPVAYPLMPDPRY